MNVAWAVLYCIYVRHPVPCGKNVRCVNVNCSWSCYEATGESHFVEFHKKVLAERFVANLEPYNFDNTLSRGVPDDKRFIAGLKLHTFRKIKGEWTDVTPRDDQ